MKYSKTDLFRLFSFFAFIYFAHSSYSELISASVNANIPGVVFTSIMLLATLYFLGFTAFRLGGGTSTGYIDRIPCGTPLSMEYKVPTGDDLLFVLKKTDNTRIFCKMPKSSFLTTDFPNRFCFELNGNKLTVHKY